MNLVRLRKGTTFSLNAIAARVPLSSSKSANTRLHEWMKNPRSGKGCGRKTKKK
jgi:hypothetical protein